jgi:hypothetical protein
MGDDSVVLDEPMDDAANIDDCMFMTDDCMFIYLCIY